jgi:hypothetical protein
MTVPVSVLATRHPPARDLGTSPATWRACEFRVCMA